MNQGISPIKKCFAPFMHLEGALCAGLKSAHLKKASPLCQRDSEDDPLQLRLGDRLVFRFLGSLTNRSRP